MSNLVGEASASVQPCSSNRPTLMGTSAPQRAESVGLFQRTRRADPRDGGEYRPGLRSLNFGNTSKKETT